MFTLELRISLLSARTWVCVYVCVLYCAFLFVVVYVIVIMCACMMIHAPRGRFEIIS